LWKSTNRTIATTIDPLNEGINSVTSRLCTIVVADSGFSALNRSTENIHKWNGTAWDVFNQSIVNVLDFGRVADNSSAFQRAIDFAESQGRGTVFIPSCTYLVSGPVN
jgi:hypothetical protein